MGIFFFLGNNKIKNALRNNAVIIDVRPPNEFDKGRVPGSVNIPVDRFSININRIKNMNRPVVICGDSWHQANAAVKMLKQNGVKDVINGDSWESLAKLLKRI